MKQKSRKELADRIISLTEKEEKTEEQARSYHFVRYFMVMTGIGILFLIMFFWWLGNGIGVKTLFSRNQSDRFTVLLAGTDMEYHGQRTDTMFLSFVFPEKKKIDLFSLPRDTRVKMREKYRKLNSAYSRGGIDGMKSAIEENFKVEIDHYALINIDGFIHIIDILGGVTIDIEQDMDYDDIRGNLHIHLKKGKQHLDGEKAMQYVRFREKLFADIGRIKRQQKFINALAGKFKDIKILWKLPALVKEVRNNIKTDLSYETILKMANKFGDLDRKNLTMQILPGDSQYIDKISYYIADTDRFHEAIEKLYTDEEELTSTEKQKMEEFIDHLNSSGEVKDTAETITDNVSDN